MNQHRLKDDYTDTDGFTDYQAMSDDLMPPACDAQDPTPSIEQLEAWMDDGVCEAVGCGCWVEADKVCECGNESWLLHLGMI